MKCQSLILALSAPSISAFVAPISQSKTISTKLSMSMIDPSSMQDLPQHVDTLHQFFSSLTLADMDVDAMSSALDAAPITSGGDTAAVDAAADAANNNGGWFGFLTLPIESLLQILHGGLKSVGVPNAWGTSIIVMTLVIKALTFPLTKGQLESTNKMQVSDYVLLYVCIFKLYVSDMDCKCVLYWSDKN